MTRRKKLKITEDSVETRYANWNGPDAGYHDALVTVLGSRSCFCQNCSGIGGKGTGSSTGLSGAPFAWVADTYSDLHKNVIPSLIDGLQLLGWELGTHYVINEAPPEEWRLRMYNVCTDWRNTMVFFTGFNFTFISLDRLAIGAGRSYVGVFGDEVKYFPEEKFTNLLKAVRGFYVKYGQSVWYRSRTLTTDMPNPNHLGEYDWILKLSAQNNKEQIMLMLRTGLVYNDCKKTYVAHLQEYRELVEQQRTDRNLQEKVDKAAKAVELAKRNMKRWEGKMDKDSPPCVVLLYFIQLC